MKRVNLCVFILSKTLVDQEEVILLGYTWSIIDIQILLNQPGKRIWTSASRIMGLFCWLSRVSIETDMGNELASYIYGRQLYVSNASRSIQWSKSRYMVDAPQCLPTYPGEEVPIERSWLEDIRPLVKLLWIYSSVHILVSAKITFASWS